MKFKTFFICSLFLAVLAPSNAGAHACAGGPNDCGPCDGSGLEDTVHYHFWQTDGPLNYQCVAAGQLTPMNSMNTPNASLELENLPILLIGSSFGLGFSATELSFQGVY
jgi:hypothetical protein